MTGVLLSADGAVAADHHEHHHHHADDDRDDGDGGVSLLTPTQNEAADPASIVEVAIARLPEDDRVRVGQRRGHQARLRAQ